MLVAAGLAVSDVPIWIVDSPSDQCEHASRRHDRPIKAVRSRSKLSLCSARPRLRPFPSLRCDPTAYSSWRPRRSPGLRFDSVRQPITGSPLGPYICSLGLVDRAVSYRTFPFGSRILCAIWPGAPGLPWNSTRAEHFFFFSPYGLGWAAPNNVLIQLLSCFTDKGRRGWGE